MLFYIYIDRFPIVQNTVSIPIPIEYQSRRLIAPFDTNMGPRWLNQNPRPVKAVPAPPTLNEDGTVSEIPVQDDDNDNDNNGRIVNRADAARQVKDNGYLEIQKDANGSFTDDVQHKLLVPACFSAEMAQLVLDKVFVHDFHVLKPKREYSNNKFEAYFTDGVAVYDRLIHACKMHFIRYITINEDAIHFFIEEAAEEPIPMNCDKFSKPWMRVMEWRKNWSSSYNRIAGQILKEVATKHSLINKSGKALQDGYFKAFNFNYVAQLFSEISGRTIDWRRTLLEDKQALSFYATVFTWTMIYHHRATFPVPVEEKLTRLQALENIKAIGMAKEFTDVLTIESQYKFLPYRPPASRRSTKRKRIEDPTELDVNFQVVNCDDFGDNHYSLRELNSEG